MKSIRRRSVAASRVIAPHTYKTKTYDGRDRVTPVESLQRYMRAYGIGTEGHLARLEFARRCDTSVQYLVQLGLGLRRASVLMAMVIERASHGLVRCEELAAHVDWDYLMERARLPTTKAPVQREATPPALPRSKRAPPPRRRTPRPPPPPDKVKSRRRGRVVATDTTA